MKNKVAVIGGGTAGLITAKKLAQLGVETVVYDQKRELGLPIRASGIVSINGLNGLGIDYKRGITNTLNGARIHSGRESMVVKSKKPIAHVLNRKLLNDICHDEAVANGADVVLKERISGQRLDDLSVSNIVVGADGAISEVARHFGLGDLRKYAVTYKAEFNMDIEETGMVDIFIDNRISKGLFGWFCPNEKDVLEVGVGVETQYGNAKTAFDKFISSEYVSEFLKGSTKIGEAASMIPMALRRRIVDEKKEVLLVGDAAGQVKPSTGGGIVYGGNAAIMAADVINKHLLEGVNLGLYEKLYQSKYGVDTRLHSMINTLYSSFGADLMIKTFNLFRVDSFLSKYGDMDMPSMMLKKIFLRSMLG